MVMKTNPIMGKMDKCSQGLGMLGMSGLRDPCYQYVEQCVTQLEGRGVNFQAIQTDGFRGQYKFALAPLPPLQEVEILLDADSGSLASIVGRPMIELYVEMKRHELARLKRMDVEEVRELFIELF